MGGREMVASNPSAIANTSFHRVWRAIDCLTDTALGGSVSVEHVSPNLLPIPSFAESAAGSTTALQMPFLFQLSKSHLFLSRTSVAIIAGGHI